MDGCIKSLDEIRLRVHAIVSKNFRFKCVGGRRWIVIRMLFQLISSSFSVLNVVGSVTCRSVWAVWLPEIRTIANHRKIWILYSSLKNTISLWAKYRWRPRWQWQHTHSTGINRLNLVFSCGWEMLMWRVRHRKLSFSSIVCIHVRAINAVLRILQIHFKWLLCIFFVVQWLQFIRWFVIHTHSPIQVNPSTGESLSSLVQLVGII